MMTLNSVIPTDVRKFQEWSKNLTSFQDIITQWLDMYEFDQDAHNKFKSYVFLLDEIRGCNFRETFGPSW